MAVNYSILTDVEFSTKGIKKNLQDAVKKSGAFAEVDVKVKGKQSIEDMDKSMNDAALTFQAANAIFRQTIDIITSMASEVYKLNGSIIEFQKVSDYSGQALQGYLDQLGDLGKTVARTGKPKCQAPNVGMINQHLYLP